MKPKPAHKPMRIKGWYVLDCTNGKDVEYGYIGRIRAGQVELIDPKTGKTIGWNPLKYTFLTRDHAVQNWRYRSSEETVEHATALETAAAQLLAKAARLKAKRRIRGNWRDL